MFGGGPHFEVHDKSGYYPVSNPGLASQVQSAMRLLRDHGGLHNTLIRPYFLGGVALGGYP